MISRRIEERSEVSEKIAVSVSDLGEKSDRSSNNVPHLCSY